MILRDYFLIFFIVSFIISFVAIKYDKKGNVMLFLTLLWCIYIVLKFFFMDSPLMEGE